ncbi:MAG: hypothetical protein SP4CHLAM1_08410 [Chlamydiia bacterium]|nr:hypothetical protein [Chlamydiia bacterium]
MSNPVSQHNDGSFTSVVIGGPPALEMDLDADLLSFLTISMARCSSTNSLAELDSTFTQLSFEGETSDSVGPAASPLSVGPAASPLSVGPAASPLSVGPAASPLSVGPAASPLSVGPAASPLSVGPAAGRASVGPAAGRASVGPAAGRASVGPAAKSAMFGTDEFGNRVLLPNALADLIRQAYADAVAHVEAGRPLCARPHLEASRVAGCVRGG